ncbi:hypothetical protein [Snuella lapsa]|uniref:hypothetical protein n=1 Tax=Snuella lapsa TaxID=870481 RepID=UPI0031E7711B
MKQFEVYRNIRKRAMVMGLPVSSFAIMMMSVIGSLLFIIFSFSLKVIISVFLVNGKLYIALTHLAKHPALLHFKKVFPKTISNKKVSPINYEDH